MKRFGSYLLKAIVRGALIVLPVYLAILLLLKAAASIAGIVRPIAKLLPDWFPAANVLSLLLVLIVCFLVGVLAQSRASARRPVHASHQVDFALGNRIEGTGGGDERRAATLGFALAKITSSGTAA